MRTIFPFTAIVGQETMKTALILNAISPRIGGLLIRGERGTAKSTAARALAALLPEIEVVADCPFNCDPHRPERMCDHCCERVAQGEVLPIKRRKTRFVDLPVSATEDRVVGTLDIEVAIKTGRKKFEPGVLAAANRGLLYVDEVNLLDDHVVDLLLDSAAMGRNVVEREGISFSHPARFILVGTMNPEEGELRPQLLDRFALCVEIRGITDPQARVDILERTVQFESDPEGFRAEWEPYEEQLSRDIARARELVPVVTYEPRDLYTIAELTTSFEVDGHRADIVILKTALAHAGFRLARNGAHPEETAITELDILAAAELALPHRLKRLPFQETENRLGELGSRLEEARREAKESKAPGASMAPIGSVFKARRVESPMDRLTRRTAGKRSTTRTSRKRGRYIQAQPADGDLSDIALDATIRQAALQQVEREGEPGTLTILPDDVQKKLRVRRASNLILFVVDASWSMAGSQRMEATKGAIMSLLVDAYQKRDRVGLVVFQKEEARLVLPFTSSVELAQGALRHLPVGGKTPLSAGLMLAYRVFRRELRLQPEAMPLLILLTDGAGNVSLTETPPQEEAQKIADLVRKSRIHSVVINMEHEAYDRGLAQNLARALGGPCYCLAELKAAELYRTVREQLDGQQ
jgi:magnesium chelatase subunit D